MAIYMISKMALKRPQPSGIVIKKGAFEWIGIWILLIFSFINVTALVVSMVVMLFFLKQREIGAIKILNILTLRTIINPALAVDIGSVQTLKWGLIFLCSFYLMFSFRRIDQRLKVKFTSILYPILFFGLYSIASSLATSTLPVVAVAKLLSYLIAFLGILIGIYMTTGKIDWLKWVGTAFIGILTFSIPLIFSPIGYFRNGHAFQGITNHPNMFGIILTLFFGLMLTRLQLKKDNNLLFSYIILGLLLYLAFLAKSRTSVISMAIMLLIYAFFAQTDLVKKVLTYSFIGVFSITYAIFDPQFPIAVSEFLYKGQENILYSRSVQIDTLIANFARSPLFGSGFAVPVTFYRSFAFNLDYIVEPGNLILAVLSYGGVIGLILFIGYLFRIFKAAGENYKLTIFLFLSPILISMGEMVFFSTNNIGIWLYMLIGLSMVVKNDVVRVGAK